MLPTSSPRAAGKGPRSRFKWAASSCPMCPPRTSPAAGVEVTVGEFARPMTGMQATTLRDRMQELQKQPASGAVQNELVDIRAKLLLFNHNRLISPVLAETRTLRIAIAPDAEPGRRELRVSSPQGLSNPIVFCIGQLPEVQEKETIDIVRPAANQAVNQVRISQPRTDMSIALPGIRS